MGDLKEKLRSAIKLGKLSLKRQPQGAHTIKGDPAGVDAAQQFYEGAKPSTKLKKAKRKAAIAPNVKWAGKKAAKGKRGAVGNETVVISPQLHQVYNPARKRPPATESPAESGSIEFLRTGPFWVPDTWKDLTGKEFDLLRPAISGIERQISTAPTDHAQLVLGLDFGTSCVKAVIRDVQQQRSYAVQFGARGDSRFLLPSKVNRLGGEYFLDGPGQALRDLKLPLILSSEQASQGAFDDACGFLALVLRHCRGWFLEEYRRIYQDHELEWAINLGIPARSYEDRAIVDRFRRLAWVAANVASSPDQSITSSSIEKWKRASNSAHSEPESRTACEFGWEDVDVIPEVAAQAHGFVDGVDWDFKHRPMLLLVDIGAGTVDSAFLSVTGTRRSGMRFAFFSNRVEQQGAINLHRKRVAWLSERLAHNGLLSPDIGKYLGGIERPTSRLAAIPEAVDEYVPGIQIRRTGGALTVDDQFYRRYRAQVVGTTQEARFGKGVPASQCQDLPLILCGGASRLSFYRRVVEEVNSSGLHVTAQVRSLPKPRDLLADGLQSGDYDRLSVAYGLSRQRRLGESVAKYIRSIEIPKAMPLRARDLIDPYAH